MEHNKLRDKFQTEEVENNWAISYGDMITLLLGFFVIFFNIKTETINLKLIKKDIDKYFKEAAQNADRQVASTSGMGKQKKSPIASSDIINSLNVKSNIEGERILVEFPGVSFFESGTHNLTNEGKESLEDFSKAIDAHLGDFRLVVRGYTDPRPIVAQKQYKDNLELSAFRSISAIRYLAKQGLKLENMRIAGYGEASFDRSLKDQTEWEQQRKVVIVIEPLDHTERSQVTPDEASLPTKSIESVSKASVAERLPTSVAEALTLKTILHELIFKVGLAHLKFQEALQVLKLKIESNSYYQKFVDYLVYEDLRKKGYGPKKTDQLINEYNKKQGAQQ